MLFIGSWCRTHTGIMDIALVIPAAPTERVMRSAASEEREIPSSTSRRCWQRTTLLRGQTWRRRKSRSKERCPMLLSWGMRLRMHAHSFARLQSSCDCAQSPVPLKFHDLPARHWQVHLAHPLCLHRHKACHSMLVLLLQCKRHINTPAMFMCTLHVQHTVTVYVTSSRTDQSRMCVTVISYPVE